MAWDLDQVIASVQFEHDRKHPGKVCSQCPSEQMHRAQLRAPRHRAYPSQRPLFNDGFSPCACGCGKEIHNRQNWDGYHGPSEPQLMLTRRGELVLGSIAIAVLVLVVLFAGAILR